ncbi:dual specificity protein phosphatase, putative [Bodo saltans]|uniref:Dual specificity protein phosphatase, putative n=1 Tax=Bodo saltans TaxID=75058 RepID=A0A0S4J521_BODSA|nr:dual specificity protein phosphatase, putative [Bodo saltans]|eukprot:CUG82951.1 dual specificity protein phosphatase, putative [Bodo saltans]
MTLPIRRIARGNRIPGQSSSSALADKETATLYMECITVLFEVISAFDKANNLQDVDVLLESFRMAMTNIPLERDRVSHAWQSLRPSLASLPEITHLEARVLAVISDSVEDLPRDAVNKTVAPVPAYKLKSCYVQQEMHMILPGLYVGSYHPAASRSVLDAQGITHICCCINVSPRFPDAYSYLVLPADDNSEYDISPFFATSFQFINAALSSGGRVLVHCGAGISRAPTITASYMIQKLGIGTDEALRMIKSIRSCASPNKGFVEHLRKLSLTNKSVA